MQQASLAQKSKYTLNVLVVGDRRTGKTSLFSRFADPDAPYPPGLGSTIGCDFKTRSIELEGKTLQLHIWDTSYSGRFQDSPWIYCRNPHVALVVFDASAQETFDDVHNWLRELEERTTGVVPVLVGNKVDISDRRVDTRTAVAVATRYGIPYVETSAEQNVNVDEAFMAGVVKSKFLLDAFHGEWNPTLHRRMPSEARGWIINILLCNDRRAQIALAVADSAPQMPWSFQRIFRGILSQLGKRHPEIPPLPLELWFDIFSHLCALTMTVTDTPKSAWSFLFRIA
eukprot:m.109440 g.109440  ORF g.109440 m.109440 type:complete len:285 (+) comp12847_c0_seq4:176-1030(+)